MYLYNIVVLPKFTFQYICFSTFLNIVLMNTMSIVFHVHVLPDVMYYVAIGKTSLML